MEGGGLRGELGSPRPHASWRASVGAYECVGGLNWTAILLGFSFPCHYSLSPQGSEVRLGHSLFRNHRILCLAVARSSRRREGPREAARSGEGLPKGPRSTLPPLAAAAQHGQDFRELVRARAAPQPPFPPPSPSSTSSPLQPDLQVPLASH